ncbi:MAG: hypothetical protein H0U74_01755 [Bradymonadaceae bacterium]|nr:hypothetical protein [Lujinxingiaceae bacterium]
MPEPPLLLADRVTAIDAEPGVLSTGTIYTETDVRHDSWYLNQGYMPAGIMIESGQADLLLISWMGVDFLNKSERIYRLLGCELTYHGGLPKAGDTLAFDIHIDAHANQGDIRLFFFHYDCHIAGDARLSVRHGQAGFFTDAELADSMGVLWDAATGEHRKDVRLDPPAVDQIGRSFTHAQVQAFAQGDAFGCFGKGYELLQTHTRTPKIQAAKMCLMGEVVELDTNGGPWKRGYLRSVLALSSTDWFLEGHFKHDPCMPGTLMFEGGLQAMAFYMSALGYTLKRDGWRFEPVPDVAYMLRCRGQATPRSRELVYELFVEEVIDGPIPMLFVDILATVDGLKAFHCRGMGVQLVVDWPLANEAPLREVDDRICASTNGFVYDYASMIACALGKPSDAMGPLYAPFDGTRRMPRLPGAPYHFLTRATALDGTPGVERVGTSVVLEYDVPADAWYFTQGGARTMPFCVLLEAGLQPCGWLSLFTGAPVRAREDLYYRNLDGTGTLLTEILPDSGTLRTHVTLKSAAQSAGMVIQSFDVEMYLGDTRFYTMDTTFGFFPAASLARQAGIAASPQEQSWLAAPNDFLVDLTARPPAFFDAALRLPEPMLLMIDRVDGFWPDGGQAGLGLMRARKDVDVNEWFFKAHFYQDPVQPGSLGIEAMIQTLQFFMIERGLADDFANPRFEPLALAQALTWKYRGQVLPQHRLASVELEITAVEHEAHSVLARATAHLWVDGLRIYSAHNLAMRVSDVCTP